MTNSMTGDGMTSLPSDWEWHDFHGCKLGVRQCAPKENGATWESMTEDERFGSCGFSEAQALNNLLSWLGEFSHMDEPPPYGDLPPRG